MALKQQQEVRRNAENATVTTRELEKMIKDMMIAIEDYLSELASFDNEEDGDVEDDERAELGSLSEDDKTGWVVGTIPTTVLQRLERFRPKQMKLD